MSASLQAATVQEIQLELIRRTTFNAMHGDRIFDSLLRIRHLWLAVLLDRPGVSWRDPKHLLRACSLIKLRDLPDDVWNADQLFILTRTPADAEEIARIAKEEDWCGDPLLYSQDEIDNALGSGRIEYGLLSIWWD